jgi:hypothetical protein
MAGDCLRTNSTVDSQLTGLSRLCSLTLVQAAQKTLAPSVLLLLHVYSFPSNTCLFSCCLVMLIYLGVALQRTLYLCHNILFCHHYARQNHNINVLNILGITGFSDFVDCLLLRLALSKGPNIVDVFPLTWGQKQIQFSKRVFYFLEYWMMDIVQKPCNSECYTPSSEPFGIYLILWQTPGNLGRCHSTDSWLPMSYPRQRIQTVIQLHATAGRNIVSAATAMHCDWIEAFHQ